jgi:hypothetical protein
VARVERLRMVEDGVARLAHRHSSTRFGGALPQPSRGRGFPLQPRSNSRSSTTNSTDCHARNSTTNVTRIIT